MVLLVLPLLTGLFLALSLSIYSWSWLVVISLVPLFVYIRYTSKGWFQKHPALLLWAVGILFTGYIQSWMLHVDPLIWAQVNPAAIRSITGIAWVVCTLMYSVNFLLFGVFGGKKLIYFIRDKKFVWKNFVQLIALWVLAEWSRAMIVSIVSWGHGASIGPYWNFGSLGFALSATPLGFIARISGLYGLSAVVIALNLLIVRLLWGNIRQLIWCGATLVVIALACFTFYNATSGKTINTAIVQTPNVVDGYQESLLSTFHDHSASEILPTDLLVLPEGIKLNSTDHTKTTQAILSYAVSTTGIAITSGVPGAQNNKTLDVQTYNNQGDLLSSRPKTLLSPVGEFSPALLKLIFRLTNNKQLETAYGVHHSVEKGIAQNTYVDIGGIKYGALSCSGILSSVAYQQLSRRGAEILINSANLEIFNFGNQYDQIRQIAHFQAVANARPFIHVANGGYSYIFDANGKIKTQSHGKELAVYTANITTNKRKTIFSILGEWTVFAAAFYLLGTYAYMATRKFAGHKL